jgi:glycolate oxidase FAD binding subunit
MTLAPKTIDELAGMVRATPKLLPVGSGTKPRLSRVEAVKVSTAGLSGLVEYDPSEFTFTALAGTPVRDIMAQLAQRGQYLPFDPPLHEAGATLGGTVAAGLNGPGRFRLGGVRDFILGVRFVDGLGRVLRAGGKVVKNAAGFDLPKFFVGSCGRFGVLAELTFKVLPRPAASLTLRLEVETIDAAARILIEAGRSRWEPDALDVLPGGRAVCVRLTGPAVGLEGLASDVFARWPGRKLSPEEARTTWADLGEFRWAHAGGWLIKVPVTPAILPEFSRAMASVAEHTTQISGGGNVAYVSLAGAGSQAPIDSTLAKLGLSALTLRGEGPLWLGVQPRPAIVDAIKQALDPENRFPSLRD